MTTAHYDSIDAFDDIESINYYRDMTAEMTPEEALEKINFGSRDNARHPMAWDSSEYGGFSTAKPWIALHSRQKEINLEKDLAAGHSVFRFYRGLLQLRNTEPALTEGELEVLSHPEDDYFAYTRTLDGDKILIVCNFEKEQDISLPTAGTALLANLGRKDVSGNYAPYECAVFRV